MPVLVSLEQLVALPNSRPLWPQEFESLVVEVEKDPNDKLPWGVAADWLCEDKIGETDLGEAFRWIHKRGQVKIEAATESYNLGRWRFKDKTLPSAVRDSIQGYYVTKTTADVDDHTLAGLAAKLAAGLRHLKSEMF